MRSRPKCLKKRNHRLFAGVSTVIVVCLVLYGRAILALVRGLLGGSCLDLLQGVGFPERSLHAMVTIDKKNIL